MEIIVTEREEFLTGSLLRGSIRGSFLHQGDPLLVACALPKGGPSRRDAEIRINRVGETEPRNLQGLAALVKSQAHLEWSKLCDSIEEFLAARDAEVTFSRFEDPVKVQARPIVLTNEPTVIDFASGAWPLGEYQLLITVGERTSRKTRETLFAQPFFVLDANLCVVNALEMLSTPRFQAFHPERSDFSVSALLAEVCVRRRSMMHLEGRDMIEIIDKANGAAEADSLNMVRQLLKADIETLFSYAESFLFDRGTIEASVDRDHEGGAKVSISVLPAREAWFLPPSPVMDLLLQQSLLAAGAHVHVAREDGEGATINYSCSVAEAGGTSIHEESFWRPPDASDFWRTSDSPG